MDTRPCWRCGTPFEPAQADSMYCRKGCRDTTRNQRAWARKNSLDQPAPHPKYTAWVEAGLAAERAAVEARKAAAEAETARAARCPRPDKEVWGTREAVEEVIRLMRATNRPGAGDLHPYLCDCGSFHAGSRAAYERSMAYRTREAS